MSELWLLLTNARQASLRCPCGQARFAVYVRRTPFGALAHPYTVRWPRGSAVDQLVASSPTLHCPTRDWIRTTFVAGDVHA